MTGIVTAPRAGASQMTLVLITALLVAAMTWFVARILHYLTDYTLESYTGYFWSRRVGLVMHLSGGILALVTGLVQIWLGLSHRTSGVHRVLGKVYVTSILVASMGGFYLAFTIPGPPAYRTGLIFLNVAWLVTTGTALYAIGTRRIQQHREWMLRSYIVTFAFVTYRLGEKLVRQWVTVPDVPDADDIAVMMAWACWAVPLLLAEPLIQLQSMRRQGRSPPSN
jgi:uncharacterized membrane protein